jgi:hypothetical protein
MKRLTATMALVAASVFSGGCVEEPAPGEWGELRYFAEVPGRVPMRLLPPLADREGHLYVLHGDPSRAEAFALIGQPDGSWSSGCELHKGDTRGLHGWVGADDNNAWYWSGDALVQLSGSTSGCELVLDRDPSSNSSIRFAGVFPWIEDTPSATRASAVIRAGDSSDLYHVAIELDLNRYSAIKPLEPLEAEQAEVAGVGANSDEGHTFLLLSYTLNGSSVVEGRTMDKNGNTLSSMVFENLSTLEEDAVQGYLQGRDGVVAGVIAGGDVVIYSSAMARVMRPPAGMNAVGVHLWHGEPWLVGTVGDIPHVAPVHATGVGEPLRWTSSETATAAIESQLEVVDERNDLRYRTVWNSGTSAIGSAAFMSPHSPSPYTVDSTTWLVAGPSFDTGIEGMTAVAVGSVGISYP